jgi:hypothetical protein
MGVMGVFRLHLLIIADQEGGCGFMLLVSTFGFYV